jgi:exosortase A-associated hydrolase 1
VTATEYALRFDCAGVPLIGIVHPAATGTGDIGVVVVVGGPQYRIGSHRQFVLLARDLAGAGFPVFRFDLRGMGDSGGAFPGFEAVDDDIAAAIDAFQAAEPAVRRVVLWGLCDGASAIMFYAHRDRRVVGIATANPWVRTEEGFSRTQLRHYYLERLLRREFWLRLLRGNVDLVDAFKSFAKTVRKALAGAGAHPKDAMPPAAVAGIDPALPLPERMAQGFAAFDGPSLLIISGNDLTAREFEDVAAQSPRWQQQLARGDISRCDLAGADHTLSHREWADAASASTARWLLRLRDPADRRNAR